MIITCPSCKKKFVINENLIPDNGRMLKCGSCDQTWFFKKDEKVQTTQKSSTSEQKINKINDVAEKEDREVVEDVTKLPKKKGSELVKYKSKSNFTISSFLRYLIVILITFIGLIIILDTFKSPLSTIFPDLELLLYNLYETLKDLTLFVKDLR